MYKQTRGYCLISYQAKIQHKRNINPSKCLVPSICLIQDGPFWDCSRMGKQKGPPP